MESITVGLFGLIIVAYGLQGLLTGRISAPGNSWKAGWQADGSAAFFICLAVSLFGAGVIYAAFKNWRS
uniref:hypothetical protein n=1 Tax=Cellvibrio fontiphilus TaxID=1815559 RepID=UPI002B4BEBFC|nr:hypothetical protein [Cellvibrio fontiphilus]